MYLMLYSLLKLYIKGTLSYGKEQNQSKEQSKEQNQALDP